MRPAPTTAFTPHSCCYDGRYHACLNEGGTMDRHPSTVGKPTHAGLRGVLISLVFIAVLATVGAIQARPAAAALLPQVVTAPAAPTVTSFTPAAGPVGTTVTVTGTHFTGATKVAFHGVAAVFSVNSATKITATVPSGATTGTIAVPTL